MAIVVFGAGGQARVLLELMDRAEIGPIAGIVDENPALLDTKVDGIHVIGTPERLPSLARVHHFHRAVIAIGDNQARLRLGEYARSIGLRLPVLVHPSAVVSPTAHLGDGTVVLAGAVVGAYAQLGSFCIVNTRSSVDHECQIGDGVHIAPGATLTGHVTVGDRALIGAGATVLPEICIGDEAIVGAGAVVVKDVPSHVTVIGCPARVMERAV